MKVRENFFFRFYFLPTGIFAFLFSPILFSPHDLFGQKSLYVRAGNDFPHSDVCVEEEYSFKMSTCTVLEEMASTVAKEML